MTPTVTAAARHLAANKEMTMQDHPKYQPLELVNRPTVTTEEAAFYLNRRPQTLRGWACSETYPEGLRPVRVNGRLCWPVAGIKAVLGLPQ